MHNVTDGLAAVPLVIPFGLDARRAGSGCWGIEV